MKRSLGIILVLMLCISIKVNAQDSFNYVIGTQSVGAKYKFTKETTLVETAEQIYNMGSNLLKISMSPRYWWENYDVPRQETITSLVELAQEESFKRVLDMPFAFYQIWAYEFSQYRQEPLGEKRDENQVRFINGLSDEDAIDSYREVYDLSKYLLETYSNSGKTFMLGNWEGDWHLFWDYDAAKPANMQTIEGMIKWFNVRQKAVDDAKRDTPHSGVELYHYMEMNHSALAISGKPCLTNSVLPNINPDFVSFSSYSTTNPPQSEDEMHAAIMRDLDYINSKIKPKDGIEGRRLFIGEYGWSQHDYAPEVIDQRAKWVIKSALEWGTPYILFWEMYNNELTIDGKNRGFWLIDENERQTPLYHTHSNFYKEAKKYVSHYIEKHGCEPSHEEFCKAAVKFKALK